MSTNCNMASPKAPSDLPGLRTALMELDDLLVSCMKCGLCQSVCPVYGTTMKEGDVTRGKIALLENLAKKMTVDAQGVNDKLNRCLLCGSCEANCPSGVKIMDIFLRARAVVAGYMGLSPIKKLIFRGLLTRPELFNGLLSMAGKFQGLFLRKANPVVGTSCAPMLKKIIGNRHFPSLPSKSMHAQTGYPDTPAGKSGLKVAFFPGCVTDKMFPNVGIASLKALEHHGVGVYLPKGQVCCGIPALASGDRADYDQMVAMNISIFKNAKFDYLLTPCATCASTIKEIWPKLCDNYPPEVKGNIQALHEKTMDVVQFLVDVLKIELPKATEDGKKVTYHDSCHMRNSLKVTAQPRKILESLPGYSYVEMPKANTCCGSGGSFTLYHYDLSGNIGQEKRDNIISVKPDTVAAACPAPLTMLAGLEGAVPQPPLPSPQVQLVGVPTDHVLHQHVAQAHRAFPVLGDTRAVSADMVLC